MHKRRKHKRRVPSRVKQPLVQQTVTNSTWSMDFMSDGLASGARIRTLNVINDCSREVLAIEITGSIPSERMTRVTGPAH